MVVCVCVDTGCLVDGNLTFLQVIEIGGRGYAGLEGNFYYRQ